MVIDPVILASATNITDTPNNFQMLDDDQKKYLAQLGKDSVRYLNPMGPVMSGLGTVFENITRPSESVPFRYDEKLGLTRLGNIVPEGSEGMKQSVIDRVNAAESMKSGNKLPAVSLVVVPSAVPPVAKPSAQGMVDSIASLRPDVPQGLNPAVQARLQAIANGGKLQSGEGRMRMSGAGVDETPAYLISGTPGIGAMVQADPEGQGRIVDAGQPTTLGVPYGFSNPTETGGPQWKYDPNAGQGAGTYTQNADGSFRRVSDVGVLNNPVVPDGMVSRPGMPNMLDPDIRASVLKQGRAKVEASSAMKKASADYQEIMDSGYRLGDQYRQLEEELKNPGLSDAERKAKQAQADGIMSKLELHQKNANSLLENINKHKAVIADADAQLPTLMQENLTRQTERQRLMNEYAQQRANPAITYANKEQSQMSLAQQRSNAAQAKAVSREETAQVNDILRRSNDVEKALAEVKKELADPTTGASSDPAKMSYVKTLENKAKNYKWMLYASGKKDLLDAGMLDEARRGAAEKLFQAELKARGVKTVTEDDMKRKRALLSTFLSGAMDDNRLVKEYLPNDVIPQAF